MILQDSSAKESPLTKKYQFEEKTIRVVTIDDSALIRLTLSRYLSQFSDIEVVGQGGNGREMLALVESLLPDVVVLDVEMPVMNGLEALEQLMHSHPLPVIMLSNLTGKGAEVTLQALELGAVDFVIKPQPSITMAETVALLVQKIRQASQAQVQYRPDGFAEDADHRAKMPAGLDSSQNVSKRVMPLQPMDTLLAIASSTGGPSALTALLSTIPPGLPLGGVIIQHMPMGFTAILGQRLNRISSYKIMEAVDGSRLMRGQFLIAPGGYHLTFDKMGVAALNEGPPVNGVRPAADVTFQSLAQTFGQQIIVVVLTGMGNDGFVGAREIHQFGGKVIAQDEKSAVIFGMPRQIIESNLAEHVATPEMLGVYLAGQVAA